MQPRKRWSVDRLWLKAWPWQRISAISQATSVPLPILAETARALGDEFDFEVDVLAEH